VTCAGTDTRTALVPEPAAARGRGLPVIPGGNRHDVFRCTPVQRREVRLDRSSVSEEGRYLPPSGAHRAPWTLRIRSGHEEHRRSVGSPEADEQASLGLVPRTERIDPPVHDTYATSPSRGRQQALRRPSEFGTVTCRQPQVAQSDPRGGNRPTPEGALHGPGRVTSCPLRVDGHRYHARRASANVPEAGEPAPDASGSDRAVAVAIAPSPRRRQGSSQRGRKRPSRCHGRSDPRTERSQSLERRSRQARAVRGTCSEKPVSRCSTCPSDHSRNTWGIR